MDYKQLAREILDEWDLCDNAQVPSDVVALQLELDDCFVYANTLKCEYAWGSDEEALIQAYNKFVPKLQHIKERIVLEVLKSTSVRK